MADEKPATTTQTPAPPAAPDPSIAAAQQTVLEIDKLFDAPEGYQAKGPVDGKPSPSIAPPPARTYADPEEETIFKNMANESYDKLYPLWSQIKKGDLIPKTELEKMKHDFSQSQKSRWYDHPKGYKLSDEYQTAADDNQLYQDIVAHYQNALVAVEAGKPFFRVIPHKEQKWIIDQQTAIPASGQAKAFITTELSRFFGSQRDAEAKLKDFETNYAPRFEGVKQAIAQVDKDIFSQMDGKPGFQQAWQNELNFFPAEVRAMPEYTLLAKASVVLKAIQNMQRANYKTAQQNASLPNNVSGGVVDGTKTAMARLDEIANR